MIGDLDALIDSRTRLVAVTLVGSDTGFTHDLKSVCEAAHAKGSLVYADVIQAAGAIPIDVKDSGVDFCCAGTYKWMMGAFGTAFPYVRPDRLPRADTLSGRLAAGEAGRAPYLTVRSAESARG
ncbi:MAG: aminotransferase class V-fold PLP-dependent enzyme [Steroidobacteraceae bacterium]